SGPHRDLTAPAGSGGCTGTTPPPDGGGWVEPTTGPGDIMRVPVTARLLLLVLACFALAACGGSADDANDAAPATTAAASPACADAAALKASVAALDQQIQQTCPTGG
ncbi:MAG TPA: hypothetical protein VFW32_06685, partial [Actinomycetes bacterium]|nr:hypothetical protein [Actinomycetes bacterium]